MNPGRFRMPVDTLGVPAVMNRLESIIDLIELYRQQNEDFIKALYEKRKAGKAA
jgi:hypothetical protein